jgi:hypothetical protein
MLDNEPFIHQVLQASLVVDVTFADEARHLFTGAVKLGAGGDLLKEQGLGGARVCKSEVSQQT